MPLPANFSGFPAEDPSRDFRNLCIEFKKLIKSNKDSVELQTAMEGFINACRSMDWHSKTSGVYHKEAGEKAAQRVFSEFDRYIGELRKSQSSANPQDLLNAIGVVEQLIRNRQVS